MKTPDRAQDLSCPADLREGISQAVNPRHPFGRLFPASRLSASKGPGQGRPHEPSRTGGFLAALVLAFVCGSASLRAADSTFSLDNRFVYVAGSKGPGLEEIDLTGKTRRMIDLSAHLDERIVAVSADSSGLLVCATARAIWRVDPAAATCEELVKVPEGYRLVDTACDPKTGDLLVLCVRDDEPGQWLYFLPKDGKALIHIRNRYETFVWHPVFTRDGTLYFTSSGDLWLGEISKEEDDPESPPYGSLDATRCLPLADLVVGNHTPASTGLRPIGPGGDWMFAGYGRLGGTGWASLIRFKLPAPPNTAARETDAQRWQKLIALIGSAEVLIEDFECETMCFSRDGRLVFILRFVRDGSPDCFLSSDGGRPVPLEIAARPGS